MKKRLFLTLFYCVMLQNAFGQCILAQFRADTLVCTGQPLTIFNTSCGAGALSYVWSAAGANLTQATTATPIISYANQGTYTVCLTTKSTVGTATTTASACRQVRVGNPSVNFTANTTSTFCPPLFVNTQLVNTNCNRCTASIFTQNQTLISSQNVACNGNFDNIYSGPGIYTVKVVCVSPSGCRDSVIKYDYIQVGGSTMTANITTTSGCAPFDAQVNLTNISSGTTSIAFDPQDSCAVGQVLVFQNPNSTATLHHIYTCAGGYNGRIILQDNNGCSRIYPLPEVTVTTCTATQTTKSDAQQLQIVPNPATTSFQLTANADDIGRVFSIIDMVGNTVYTAKINATTENIDTQNFASGVYYVQLQGVNGSAKVAKLVVLK